MEAQPPSAIADEVYTDLPSCPLSCGCRWGGGEVLHSRDARGVKGCSHDGYLREKEEGESCDATGLCVLRARRRRYSVCCVCEGDDIRG